MSQPLSKRPVVVGIVGGVASGKSLVTQLLQEQGAEVISADVIAHEVLQTPEVIERVVERFGTAILSESAPTANRAIDRKKLGAMVFGDQPENANNRKVLESIVHPLIRQLGRERLERLKSESASKFIVLDVPLLIEGGWLPLCDKVIFVDTPDEVRCQNAEQRGWTRENWRARESSQLPLLEKRRQSTDVVLNTGSKESLQERLQTITDSF